MLSTRWEPWTELDRLSREMDRLFHRGGNGQSSLAGAGSVPALNVWEDDANLYAEAELPGFAFDDLNIYVLGNQLTIQGERRPPQHEGGSWHRQERGYGKFSRMIELPTEINADGVSAELNHGILHITLPKTEAVKPRRIEVKST
ncbi:Spore protein SP21 [Rubripirellula lacrimiformis]|uniref:Spore protein SP21 n=1 Tax=Rubripirellula lacrimiformis TaxID=1930273 RepID=A0A517N9V8_9BACT|nr:Hsp20/alpha crystallin family protein [Rubripirellula lacrimiformis]QDT03788.1 Spore protein SP21 [Rubripirellula lacrimiformis]